MSTRTGAGDDLVDGTHAWRRMRYGVGRSSRRLISLVLAFRRPRAWCIVHATRVGYGSCVSNSLPRGQIVSSPTPSMANVTPCPG